MPSVQTYTATRAQTALTGLNNFSSHAVRTILNAVRSEVTLPEEVKQSGPNIQGGELRNNWADLYEKERIRIEEALSLEEINSADIATN